jgi:Tfp pilus assembly protein PilF
VAAGTLALGVGTAVPVMLPRSGVYEVSVSCGYMLTMLSLGAIWCTLHETERRCGWLAAASAAYGLALGARPSLLFGAMILLVPVAQARCQRRPVWKLLVAAIGPITVAGLGLMLYNAMRFDSAFEFGQHYQLAASRPIARQFFRWRYFWFNFRVYFLAPLHGSARFPFVHEISTPPLPVGHAQVEAPFGAFGALTNIPLVWLALAAPLAWRSRSGPESSTLRWFVTGVAVLFGTCVLTLLFYEGATIRYEVEFLPTLLLLAVVGVLGLNRALAPTSKSGQADRLVWRRAARWGWGLLLGFSVALNIFASVVRCAEAHYNLGIALYQTGKPDEAIEQFQQALGIKPDYAEAHYDLGVALAHTGKIEEAIAHYEQALGINPDYAEAHNNLGTALAQAGKIGEAIAHLEQALRINPDYAEAHNNLGNALQQMGKIGDAIAQYDQALRIRPDYAEAHCDLGIALGRAGRTPEAIEHLQQALRIKPDFTLAQNTLARLRAGQ